VTVVLYLMYGRVFLVVVEKCDVAPAALQLSAPVATATSLYRQMSPGTVVNLSQRSHSAALTAVPPLPVAGGPAGPVHPASAATTSHSAVLHSIRPAATQAITVRTPNQRFVLSSLLQSSVVDCFI